MARAWVGGAEAPVLTGERLILRPLRDADLPAICALACDAEVSRGTLAIPHPYSDAHGRGWIAAARHEWINGQAATWAVERRCDGRFLGGACLSFTQDGLGEAGFWLGRPYWRQGYGAELLRCLADYAFDDLELPAITAGSLSDNRASRALQAKLGFRETGWDTVEDQQGRLTPVIFSRLARANYLAARKVDAVLLVAAVALTDDQGRVLLAQRPPGKNMAGLWEFPGGKVDSGETPEAALARELKEELGIDVSASCLAPLTFASHTYRDFHLMMPLYVCRVWDGQPTPHEGQRLAWVAPARMGDYPMPPADRPLVAMLRDLL